MTNTKGWEVYRMADPGFKGFHGRLTYREDEPDTDHMERGIWIPLGDKPAPGEMATFGENNDPFRMRALTIMERRVLFIDRDGNSYAAHEVTRYAPPETVEVPREDIQEARDILAQLLDDANPIVERMNAALRAGEV